MTDPASIANTADAYSQALRDFQRAEMDFEVLAETDGEDAAAMYASEYWNTQGERYAFLEALARRMAQDRGLTFRPGNPDEPGDNADGFSGMPKPSFGDWYVGAFMGSFGREVRNYKPDEGEHA